MILCEKSGRKPWFWPPLPTIRAAIRDLEAAAFPSTATMEACRFHFEIKFRCPAPEDLDVRLSETCDEYVITSRSQGKQSILSGMAMNMLTRRNKNRNKPKVRVTHNPRTAADQASESLNKIMRALERGDWQELATGGMVDQGAVQAHEAAILNNLRKPIDVTELEQLREKVKASGYTEFPIDCGALREELESLNEPTETVNCRCDIPLSKQPDLMPGQVALGECSVDFNGKLTLWINSHPVKFHTDGNELWVTTHNGLSRRLA